MDERNIFHHKHKPGVRFSKTHVSMNWVLIKDTTLGINLMKDKIYLPFILVNGLYELQIKIECGVHASDNIT